jgi:pimeloyl-ACP methyl ester carboxylesterase
MGGPISQLVAHRHPDLVQGMVLQATALEWRTAWRDRAWRATLPLTGSVIRSRVYPRVQRRVLIRMVGPERRDIALWVDREFGRNDPGDIVEAGKALGRYDATSWAGTLGLPTAMLMTTRDRQVRLKEQRALAAVTDAHVEELAVDHLCTIVNPAEYSAATRRLVDHVVARIGQSAAPIATVG